MITLSLKSVIPLLQILFRATTHTAMMITWLSLVSFLPVTSSTSVQSTTAAMTQPKDAAAGAGAGKSLLLQMHDSERRLFSHFKEPYTYRIRGQLTVNVSEITTSSILVKWQLSNRTFNDSTIKAIVVCETFSGMIVSKTMVSSRAAHRIEGLRSDSSYILCVDMLEKAPQVNVTVLHFTCHNAATIPVLRSDSIVGVILTLGYIFLMAAIGYFMWRKRFRELNEDKIPINADDDDEDDEDDDGLINAKGESFGRVGPSSRGKSTNASNNDKKPASGADWRRSPPAFVTKATAASTALTSFPPPSTQLETTTTTSSGGHRKGSGGGGECGATNGHLDHHGGGKTKSRDSLSSSKLLCGTTDAEMEERRPAATKSRNSEGSPVKVTEITF